MDKKYAMVTGASRGIGRAIAVKFAQMGYDVLINYASNSKEAANTLELVRAQGVDGELMQFDVSNAEAAHKAISKWQQAHPDNYIEVLANNAGIRRDNLMALMPVEDWHRVLQITLDGFFNVTQPIIYGMQIHRYGRIINTASLSGIKGLPGQTNYSAAKGGLIAATKALAQEVARRGITVNAIAPGFIKTDMLEGLDEKSVVAQIPVRRLGTPEEVAELAGFLASPQAGYITGNVISINGGLYT